MRILHTSDWHLGIALYNIPLINSQKHFINQLFNIIKNEKVDAVIVAGDMFDNSISTGEAIALYNEAVTAVCSDFKIPMFIIAGNHDGAARLASCRDLLKASGLHVTGKLTKNTVPVVLGNTAVYSIPYFNIDEVRAIYPDSEIKSYEKAMMAVCNNIRENIDSTKKNIIISHAFVSGAELSDSDRSAMIGTASMVSKDVFTGFDYVALGHLHRPQNIGGNIRYSGSPLKYSTGEANHIKSVTIIDTEDMSRSEINIPQLYDMRLIRGKYEDLISSARFSKDFVRIEISDKYISLEMLNTFKKFYPNLLGIDGKSTDFDLRQSVLTVDEVKTLIPIEIFNKFFEEVLHYSPTNKQIEMFEEALDYIENGGDLS